MNHSTSGSAAIAGPALTGLTALALFLYIAASSSLALAKPPVLSAQDKVSQERDLPSIRPGPGLRGTMLGLAKPHLGEMDRIAALRAFQTALTEVGDGTNYVWYRSRSRLSGVIRPIRSFADASGRICRELKVTLHAGRFYSRSMDGTACRQNDGSWSLGE